jgi:probable rRNA maturation factor
MIVIKNTQRQYPIDTAALKTKITKVLAAVGYPAYDLTIWFTTNATIKKYNKQFRNKDKATDVISFPYYEIKTPGTLPKESVQEPILGDIMLSPEYIHEDLVNWDQTLDERILMLIVHSICHLLGYDHETDVDFALMSSEEKKLMDMLKSR